MDVYVPSDEICEDCGTPLPQGEAGRCQDCTDGLDVEDALASLDF